MKQYNAQGSITVLVLFIISALTVSILTLFRTGDLQSDIAFKRIHAQQLHNSVQALLYLGIAMTQSNYHLLLNTSAPQVFTMEWPCGIKTHTGTITIKKNRQEALFAIEAALDHANQRAAVATCSIKKKEQNDQLIISQWSVSP